MNKLTADLCPLTSDQKGSLLPVVEISRSDDASADASALAVSAKLGEGAVFEAAGKIEVVGNEMTVTEAATLADFLTRRMADRMHEILLDSLCQ